MIMPALCRFSAMASLLLGICAATCELPLRRRHVTATWQSSFESSCFNNRSATEEAASLSGGSDFFFMSAGPTQLDSGIHWFAMVFKEAAPISSVIIKGIAAANNKFRGASANIEAWTSNLEEANLGEDHCASRNIARLFRQKLSRCRLVEKRMDGADGGIFVATCNATVKTLLLMKDLTHKEVASSGYMGFSDLVLRLQEEETTSDLETFSQRQVAVNSSFTVQCSAQCDISAQQQICTPGGSCIAGARIRITRTQPTHSGNYTCKSGSLEQVTSLAVLYPPARVSVSAGHGGCSATSPRLIVFVSDDSYPTGRHRCAATATGADSSALQLVQLRTEHSALNGSVTSWWSLSVAEPVRADNVAVRVDCQAVQQLPSGIQFPPVTATGVNLTCREMLLPSRPRATVALMAACAVVATISVLTAGAGLICYFKARNRAVGREAASTNYGNSVDMTANYASKPGLSGALYADVYCEE